MNSLLLFLFLGASVALAELPFEHPDFVEFLSEEDHEDIFGELADEENDPHRPRPRPPKVCLEKLVQCIKEHRPSGRPFTRPSGRPTRPADEENDPRRPRPRPPKECVEKLLQCIKEHRPSGRPSGRPTRPAEDYLSELDDEENDPRRPRPPKVCLEKLVQCIKEHRPSGRPFTRPSGRPTRPADEENDPRRPRPRPPKVCLEKLRQCIKEHRPSGRPSGRPFTRPSGRPTRPAEDYLSELDDEENDPRRPRPSGTPPAFVKKCREDLGKCFQNANDEPCARLKCLEQFGKCIKENLPSPRPTLPFTLPPKKKVCLEKSKMCFENAGDSCKQKIRCIICAKACLKKGRRVPRFCRPRPSGRPTRGRPSRPFTRPSGRPTRPAE
ncbi:hypothetical protein ACROYT_G038228 [Oculina patagonica]